MDAKMRRYITIAVERALGVQTGHDSLPKHVIVTPLPEVRLSEFLRIGQGGMKTLAFFFVFSIFLSSVFFSFL